MAHLSVPFVFLATAAVCVSSVNLRSATNSKIASLEQRWLHILNGQDEHIEKGKGANGVATIAHTGNSSNTSNASITTVTTTTWTPPPPEPVLMTTSTKAAAADSKVIDVASQEGFALGDPIEISSGNLKEINTIVGLGALKLVRPLKYAHPAGAVITKLKVTPIARVLNVLVEMQNEITSEKAEDKATHLKLRCWCYDNQKQTRLNIEAAEQKMVRLREEIVALAAKSAGLREAIAADTKNYEQDKKSLNEMVAIRENEQAAYDKRDVELTEMLDQLSSAIFILGRHATLALPQIAFSFMQHKANQGQHTQHKANQGQHMQHKANQGQHMQHKANQGRHKANRGVFDSDGFGMGSSASRSLDVMLESEGESVTNDDTTPAPKKNFLQAGNDGSLSRASTSADQESYSDMPASIPTADPPPTRMDTTEPPKSAWSEDDINKMRSAMSSVVAFLHRRNEEPPPGLSSFLQGSYSPGFEAQGDTIIGILKQMHDEFDEDQKRANATETEAVARYTGLFNTKDTQLKLDQTSIDAKVDAKASTDVDMADKQAELRETKEVHKENKKYLQKVTDKCAEEETAYEQRQVSRVGEANAIEQAIDVLSDDEMRGAMNHAYHGKPAAASEAASFFQIKSESRSRSMARRKAADFLRGAAKRLGSAALTQIASRVQLDSFEQVQKEIDKVIEHMKNEQGVEVEENDACKKQLHEIERDIVQLRRDLVLNTRNIAVQEDKIKDKEAKLAQANKDIATFEESLRKATEQRNEEKQAFENLKAAQWMTVQVLNKALNRLAEFYDIGHLMTDKGIGSGHDIAFAQVRRNMTGPAVMNAPPESKSYKAKAGESVMSLIEKLIFDLQIQIKKNRHTEHEADKSYDAMKEDINASLFALRNAVINYSSSIAEMKKAHISMGEDHTSTQEQLEATNKYSNTKHAQCDFVMRNFDISQAARQKEIEALQQTKQILTGAKFD